MANARCEQCGFVGLSDDFKPGPSPYHDLWCPMCGTSAIDTSELNAEWAAEGQRYGYGDDNFLQPIEEKKGGSGESSHD